MARFRTIDNASPMDEDVRALMADIDASLPELEKHLEGQRRDDEAAWLAAEASRRAVPGQPVQPEVAAGGKLHGCPATEPVGLLAELEREARATASAGDQAALDQAERSRQLHEALGRIFQFFNIFVRHANALAPAIGRTYRLDAQTAYSDLEWHEAAARSRRLSLSESALYDYVVFRVSLHTPAPVVVFRRQDQLDALHKELQILDLRLLEGLDMERPVIHVDKDKGMSAVRLAAHFPVQVTFRANYERYRIDLLCRNLEGFGIAAFTCKAEDITQSFLDDFGRYLLARSNKLPTSLSRVHCRAEL